MGCGGSKAEANDEEEDFRVEAAADEVGAGPRRVAVRTEDPTEDPDDTFDPNDTYPKSASEYGHLRKAMLNNAVFSQCSEDQLRALSEHFLKLDLEDGEIVVEQGEPGTTFFIVGSGQFREISTSEEGGAKTMVAQHETGSSFGEVSLLYRAPYAASVECAKAGDLWALERKRFRHIMQVTGAQSLAERANKFLKPVPLFSELTDEQRTSLAACLEEVRLEDGERLVAVGDAMDALYVIKSGQVAVRKNARSQGETLVLGETFGDACLEAPSAKAVHDVEVVAVGGASVLRLPSLSFRDQLGTLQEVVVYNRKRKALEALDVFAALDAEGQDALIAKAREKVSAHSRRPGSEKPTRRTPLGLPPVHSLPSTPSRPIAVGLPSLARTPVAHSRNARASRAVPLLSLSLSLSLSLALALSPLSLSLSRACAHGRFPSLSRV